MAFLFIADMAESFNGLPIWYWWGGATSFAIFFGRHLDDVKKSSNKGEPPKDFEWAASLGISMFWVFIPVFGAGWVAYKLIRTVMK